MLIAGRERERLRLPWWSVERSWSWTLRWSIGYGFDMLLPGMWLDERQAEVTLPKPLRRYFNVHRLAGYVLLLFVVAGPAGLTD